MAKRASECSKAHSSQKKPWNPGWHEHCPDPASQLPYKFSIPQPYGIEKGKVLLSNTVLALNKALELSKKLELYVGIEVQGILIYNHL